MFVVVVVVVEANIKKRLKMKNDRTKSGTNGAINAPNRATVEAEPTPSERITVGSISAV